MKETEKDKRLIIPKDAFEEEASEGLGRLSREEAEEDLRELKRRMERRLRRPRMIWLPAAAAVVILLVASAVYVSLFRERGPEISGVVLAEKSEMILADEEVFTDTALIAMAEPVQKSSTAQNMQELMFGQAAADRASEGMADSKKEKAYANVTAEIVEDDMPALNEVLEVSEEEVVAGKAVPGKAVARETIPENIAGKEAAAGEVIVEALPRMQKMAMRERAEAKDEAAVTKKKATDPATDAVASGAPATANARGTLGSVTPGVAIVAESRPASPAGGYEEFIKWLQDNVTYPIGVEPRTRQEVAVTFRVRADSTVHDLRTVRTPGGLFTLEAFRLIREGPKWAPAIRDGQIVDETVRVTVVFK